MSANPYWSYPAEEFPPSGVIALFDTAKDAPEPMHPACALTSLAMLAPANDTTRAAARVHARIQTRTPSRFELTLAWLRALILALVAPLRSLPATR